MKVKTAQDIWTASWLNKQKKTRISRDRLPLLSPHLRDSGFRGHFACKTDPDPGFWNPEYSSRNLSSQGIQLKEYSSRNLNDWNPESKTVLDSLTRGESVIWRKFHLMWFFLFFLFAHAGLLKSHIAGGAGFFE